MTALFYAHSGLRYLVLVAGVVAALYLAYALASRNTSDRPGRILTAVFTGTLDLQIVLGLLLVFAGIWYGALVGHLVMMLLAAAAAHVASVRARRGTDPVLATRTRLIGVVVALVLIVGGIMAIGRNVFGSGAPSMVS